MNSLPRFKDEQRRFAKFYERMVNQIGAESSQMFTVGFSTAVWTGWLAGQGLEHAQCANCKADFIRRRTSKPRIYCDAKRCQAIAKITNSVASFKTIRNDCSEYRADIDYHGRPYL